LGKKSLYFDDPTWRREILTYHLSGKTRTEEKRAGENQRDFSLRPLISKYSSYQSYRVLFLMLLTPNISNLNLQLMFQKLLETELVAVEKRGELAGE
jgi:hypothetical protein